MTISITIISFFVAFVGIIVVNILSKKVKKVRQNISIEKNEKHKHTNKNS